MISGLVTVVVPIFKVEKYLNRCIESIVKQTYEKIENIIVDDGSPDNCPEMCDEWAKKDSRIKVIHKQNAGLGMARNTGIDNANGEYICFFDSDDYIHPNTIEKAYISAKKYNSDIVMFGMNMVDKNGNIISKRIPKTDKEVYVDAEILDFILPNTISRDPISGKDLMFNMSSSGRLFSCKLIHSIGWRFVSEREFISEDFYSLLELYNYVKIVSIVKMAFYYYCYNEASLTHIYNPERFEKICKCHQGMIGLCEKYNYSDTIRNAVNSQFLGSVIGTMKLIVSSTMKNDEKKSYISYVLQSDYLQNVLLSLDRNKENFQRNILIFFIALKSKMVVYELIKRKL